MSTSNFRPANLPGDVVAKRVGQTRAPNPKAEIPRVAQIPPFWQYKPPFGIDFYFNTTAVLAAGAGSTVTLGRLAGGISQPLKITADYEGVVASVNIFIDAPTTAIDVDWQLRFNQSPVPGWSDLTTFPRSANSISIEFSGTLQVPGNTLIDVQVVNNAASGPWTVGVEVTGWSWPVQQRLWAFGGQA
jgi:hypothetical protein